MKIITFSVIFALAAHICLAGNLSLKASSDTTVLLLKHYTELPNSNLVALNERNATRHFSKIITLYNNLASRSLKAGSSKNAEQTLLRKSIPLSLRYGTDESDYNCFMALANIYVGQKKYSQAKWYFIQSNSSAKKGRNSKGEVLSLMRLAYVKRMIGHNSLALQDLKEAEKIAIKNKLKSTLPEIRKTIKAYSKKSPAKTFASVKPVETNAK